VSVRLRRTLLLLAVLPVVAYGVWCWLADRELREMLARVREMGPPREWRDLEGPWVPDAENAFLLWSEADEWLEQRPELRARLHGTELQMDTSAWSEADLGGFREAIADLAGYFALVEAIPSRPGWHVARRWSQGPFHTDRPELVLAQELHTLLHLRTRLDPIPEGRAGRAANGALLLLDVAERSGTEFTLAYVSSFVVRQCLPDLLKAAAAQPGFDASTFRALVDPRLSSALPPAGPPTSTIVADRLAYLWIVDRLISGRWPHNYPPPQELSESLRGSWLLRPMLAADVTVELSHFEEEIAACGVTPEEAWKHALAADDEAASGEGRRRWMAKGQYHKFYAGSAATLRLARVVMALLEARQRQGAWPETLDQLESRFPDGMPTDPYSRGPFGYECGTRVWAAVPRGGIEDLEWDLTELAK